MRKLADNLPSTAQALRSSLASAQEPSAPASKAKPSKRATQLWGRLSDWYGVRFADQFGDVPSADWCALIDSSTNEELRAVLVLVRQRHVTFPPTLPEFAALMKEVHRPPASRPLMQELLTEYVNKHHQLAPEQMIGAAWNFRYRLAPDGSPVVTAVEIAPGGGRPGYRVTVEDVQAAGVEL